MNKAVLVGRLTRDPEVRYSQGDNTTAVARYTVAVDRRFKRDGEPTADFIPCVVFGRSAEFAEKYESIHNRSDRGRAGVRREQSRERSQQRYVSAVCTESGAERSGRRRIYEYPGWY